MSQTKKVKKKKRKEDVKGKISESGGIRQDKNLNNIYKKKK